jgi:hypothetical protein
VRFEPGVRAPGSFYFGTLVEPTHTDPDIRTATLPSVPIGESLPVAVPLDLVLDNESESYFLIPVVTSYYWCEHQ